MLPPNTTPSSAPGPSRPPDATYRPPPRPAPAKGTRPAPAGPAKPPPLTPQQQALAQAQAYWQPVIDEYHRQQQQLAMEHAAQQAGLGALYSTLGGSFAGVGDQFKSIYDTAGGNISKYANGQHSSDLANYQGGLAGEGAAYQTGASAFPQIAGQQGVMAFLKAVQDANASEADLTGQLNQVTAKIPGQAQDILSANQSAQAKAQAAQLAQWNRDRDYNLKATVANNKANAPQRPFGNATIGYYQTDSKGRVRQVIPGTGPAQHFTTVGSDKTGRVVLDSQGNPIYQIPPVVSAAKAGKPGPKVIVGLTGVPLTKGQIGTYTKAAAKLISSAKAHAVSPAGAIAELGKLNPEIPPAVWRPIVEKAYGIPKNLSQLRYMPRVRLNNIASYYGWKPDPANPLNKQQLIDWIRGHAPKGDAGGSPQTASFVIRTPGMDRAGVPTRPQVIDFVGKIGQIYGQKLTIGTGSNHNQFVAGRPGHESDHWFGDAADIPMTGAALTRLGQAALIAAGADPKWARQQRGGVYNIGGYNILFNTNIGGNHYNHLHVGLGRILGRTFA